MKQLLEVLVLGVVATAVMDVWAWVQQRVFAIRPLDYRLLGRWLLGWRHGRFCHQTIVHSPPVHGERMLGWAAHYAIGVGFAAVLLSVSRPPTFWASLLMGWITLAAPFLLMQPAFGFGIAASKTPHPAIARRNSILAHTAFGMGLYVGGRVIAMIF